MRKHIFIISVQLSNTGWATYGTPSKNSWPATRFYAKNQQTSLRFFIITFYKYALFLLVSKLCTCFMFISLHICSNIYCFCLKVKFFKNTMARKGLFSFNLAHGLEKLPTSGPTFSLFFLTTSTSQKKKLLKTYPHKGFLS